MKKIISCLAIIVVIIFFVAIYVGGFTHNIKKIMPKYNTVIYSESNFLPFKKELLLKAKKELDYKYEKIKNKNYNKEDYYKKGLREILRINKTNIDNYIKKYKEENFQKYQKLEEAPYKNILTKYGYNEISKKTKLDIYLKFNNIKEEELYYEIDGFFYLPSDNRDIKKNIATKSNISDTPVNFRILKDAEICLAQGPNFLYVSNIAYIDRTNGTSFEKRIKFKDFMKVGFTGDLINTVDDFNIQENNNEIEASDEQITNISEEDIKNLIDMLTTMYLNYVTYDKKGYICDLYYFDK